MLAFVIEAATEQWVSVWFVPGAAVAIILSLCHVHLAFQIVAVLLLSAVGILLSKTVFAHVAPQGRRRGIDAAVGEKCIVTERIDNFAGCGQAQVSGQNWSARGVAEDDVFEEGEVLRVVAIEGVKLVCRRA